MPQIERNSFSHYRRQTQSNRGKKNPIPIFFSKSMKTFSLEMLTNTFPSLSNFKEWGEGVNLSLTSHFSGSLLYCQIFIMLNQIIIYLEKSKFLFQNSLFLYKIVSWTPVRQHNLKHFKCDSGCIHFLLKK